MVGEAADIHLDRLFFPSAQGHHRGWDSWKVALQEGVAGFLAPFFECNLVHICFRQGFLDPAEEEVILDGVKVTGTVDVVDGDVATLECASSDHRAWVGSQHHTELLAAEEQCADQQFPDCGFPAIVQILFEWHVGEHSPQDPSRRGIQMKKNRTGTHLRGC